MPLPKKEAKKAAAAKAAEAEAKKAVVAKAAAAKAAAEHPWLEVQKLVYGLLRLFLSKCLERADDPEYKAPAFDGTPPIGSQSPYCLLPAPCSRG
jgi:hypothetical protein